ncbi:SusC/RagA family TonB-linked outer membrane protein [Fulvitalea axinellae]|uniref:SusC/RagA family TonB-linked outer membrane protein n=1 Tax=Fulvitalea axinellae TaxID=1182444 RepID=A0AAU9CFV1_9BACT|nr:SusC/RagA family TonB-linked outer membrane protein [Fulvitalea axinellae]
MKFFTNHPFALRQKTGIILPFFLVMMMAVNSLAYAEGKTFQTDYDFKNVTVEKALNDIARKSGMELFFRNAELERIKRSVTLSGDMTLDEALKKVLKGTSLKFKIDDDQIIIFGETGKKKPAKTIQEKKETVSGVVKDESGEPVPGVSVLVKGTSLGTSTDFEGNFVLKVAKTDVLVLSSIGFATQEVSVGNRTTFDITLSPDVEQLQEVVVTALGIKREKKALGYSVTEVKSEELTLNKNPNVVNSLKGRVAGVQVSTASSGAGGASRVLIRGANSLNSNNEPLYVVDGVPVDNTPFGNVKTAGGQWDRTDYGSGISDLNPDDIESMSILKGPNAAALYGSRAANGVVLITTKQGSSRKGLGVSISSSATFESPMLLPDFQNEYGQGSGGVVPADLKSLKSAGGSWGAKLDGSNKLYWTGDEKPYSAQSDNVRDFFEVGTTFNNSVAIDGGSDKATFRFSYSNMQNRGILPGGELDRHNFNIRGTAKLSDQLSLDAKATYFLQDAKQRPFLGDNSDNPVKDLFNLPRNVDIKDLEDYKNPDGTLRSWSTGAQNPYWTQNYNVKEDTRRRLSGFVKLTYKLTDNLSVFARAGTDYTNLQFYEVYPYYHLHNSQGRYSRRRNQIVETNYDFLVMYNKELSEDFNLSLNAGGSLYNRKTDNVSNSGENFTIPTLVSPGNIPQDKKGGDFSISEKEIQSLYATGQLSFRNYAFLDLTLRNDWSSTLPSDNRSYLYPSASASVVVNDMLGLESDVLSFAKVRASWAEVGNDTDPYKLNESLQLNGLYLGKPMVGVGGQKLNSNLNPEKTVSTEIGVDLRLFENRIYADFSYYDIQTTDQIIALQLPAATGYGTKVVNVGKVTNKGVELLIGAKPVVTEDFTWDVSFNFSKNKNELAELDESIDVYQFASIQAGGGVSIVAQTDGGFGDILGRDFKRNDNGEIIVDDNGLPVADSEQKVLGNYQPDWTGGITNTLSYKGLSFNFLIDMRMGGELYSFTDADLDASGVSKNSLYGREGGIVVDGVTESGEKNTSNVSSELYFGRLSGIASEYIVDASNVRLREASLTYSLPKSWLAKTFIKNASLSLIGRNLFFLSKETENVDPESSFSTGNGQGIVFYNLPTTRSYGFNLKFSF